MNHMKKFNEDVDFDDVDAEETNITMKSTKKTIFEVDYSDFENVVQEYFKHVYEYVADVEANIYSSKSYSVNKKKLSRWDERDMTAFKETGRYDGIAGTLLQKLCIDGIIEEGEYLIDVYW